MLKNKKIIALLAVLLIGGIIVSNIVSDIKINNHFLNIRNSYEEMVKGISADDITNNAYVSSVSVETEFETKNSYKEYDSLCDFVGVDINMTDDFEALSLEERCGIIYNIYVDVSKLMEDMQTTTEYKTLLDDYAPFKGSNIQVWESVDVDFHSSTKIYSYDRKSSIYIQGETSKSGYIEYKIEWDGDKVVSVKERERASSSSSSSSSSSTSSYTGAYDATLKYTGTDGVLICISEDAMERFMTAVNNGNEGTLQELFLEGQCAYTEQGTKCNIVDRKLTKCKVKLLDGSYAGNTVWVVIESVQEE